MKLLYNYRLFIKFELFKQPDLGLPYAALPITLSKIAITAITSRTWMMLPTSPKPWNTKPITQSITNTTATKYNKFPIVLIF